MCDIDTVRRWVFRIWKDEIKVSIVKMRLRECNIYKIKISLLEYITNRR